MNEELVEEEKEDHEILHHPRKEEVEKYPLPLRSEEQPMDLDLRRMKYES